MYRLVYALMILIIASGALPGQESVTFRDGTSLVEINASSDYSLIVGDLNGDYRDDIVRSDTDSIYFYLQLGKDLGFFRSAAIEKPFDILTGNLADLDNDGRNEVIIAGNRTGVQIYEFDAATLSFKERQYIEADHYAQGACVSDIDKDGLLDYFACNDVSYNKLFVNNGLGGLSEQELVDLNILTPDMASGNYNSIWIDPDGDGDQDLYIAKCHVNASSPSDLRRVNQFFENLNGSFVENAEKWGLDQGDQSWCSSAGDLDNDGDQDILLINHKSPIVLLENKDGESYTTHEIFTDMGVLEGDEQQVIMADFNNDALLDIFIFGFNDRLLINKGDLQFLDLQEPLGSGNVYSAACGDLDNNGQLDLYAVYGVAGSSVSDKLWLNNNENNNYVRFSLNGTESNAQAVGSKLEVFGLWGKQTRWLNSGESYGISNSMNLHFGLGDASKIDSVVCFWPSGTIDRYYDISVNESYVLTEGECIQELADIDASSLYIGCSEMDVRLEADVFGLALWNDSSVSNALSVSDTGYYYAVSYGDCRNATDMIYIDTIMDLGPTPELLNSEDVILCPGQSYLLASVGLSPQLWSNGLLNEFIDIEHEGDYYVLESNGCDTLISEIINVAYWDLDSLNRSISVNEKGTYTLESGQDSTVWYNSEFDSIGSGLEYLLEDLVSDTLIYFDAYFEPHIPLFDAGPNLDTALVVFGSDSLNSELPFKLDRDVLLSSFNCYADIEGLRRILVKNASQDLIYDSEHFIMQGLNELKLDLILSPGTYKLYTDTTTNQNEFGMNSPGLAYMDILSDGIQISPMITIDADSSENLYFYNWKIKQYYAACWSGLNEYYIDLDTISNNRELTDPGVKIYPNPFEDLINIEQDDNIGFVKLVDVFGRELLNWSIQEKRSQYDLSFLNSGTYFIILEKAHQKSIHKIIKI